MSRDNEQPRAILREDFSPFDYQIAHVAMRFDLDSHHTTVTTNLTVEQKRTAEDSQPSPLLLDGVELKLDSIAIDDRALESHEYTVDSTSLKIHEPPESFKLTVVTVIDPAGNTALEGLYQSSGNFCTQCEAQGFRKITYFPDRPDVLSVYEVTIVADKNEYPVLLSNGNQLEQGVESDDRHYVKWHDPHPKPSYLFALVAGKLAKITDSFKTKSGRDVELVIYVESHNISRCDYAMQSLKRAMQWDEDVYGLEYDLDIFMIVAVDDFNMGAMENKGLNIFNSKFVLADLETATDTDFYGIESVVAHEYFHNWTGNRITCRDWFQLSLKEGLTVFRDQEFSADLNSRAVKRVSDVRLLRARQFPEDAGPMAHPIRPESYIEINNFYTVTVYEKGAEVIRMLHTILGAKRFHAGIDLYVERHDGEAATCENFVAAMEESSGVDLSCFRRWYSQAGTPLIRLRCEYDSNSEELTVSIEQSCPPTPGQAEKSPFHIPIRFSLLGHDGAPVSLKINNRHGVSDSTVDDKELVLEIKESSNEFVFNQVPANVVPSILRGFSAPVILDYQYTDEQLVRLLTYDNDPFNRWESAQRLIKRVISRTANALKQATEPQTVLSQMQSDSTVTALVESLNHLQKDSSLDDAQRADMLSLPGIETIPDSGEPIDIDGLHVAREWLHGLLATALEKDLLAHYHAIDPGDDVDSEAMGKRRFKNACLDILSSLPDSIWLDLAVGQYRGASNMTDRAAALKVLCLSTGVERDIALTDFYDRFQENRLVIDKWFSLQAMSNTPSVVEQVNVLREHSSFTLSNPNRVRSLVGVFAMTNPVGFHRIDGAGYSIVAETVKALDAANPQVAARLAGAFSQWRRFDDARQAMIKQELQGIAQLPKLSPDVFEIVNKSLA